MTSRLSKPETENAPKSGDLSVDEVHAQFAGRWILLRVTAFDQYRTPQRGEVLVSGPHSNMLKALVQLLKDRDASGDTNHYYTFHAGHMVRANAMPASRLPGAETAR